MQNLFTSEHQAKIFIDTYREEARHHDLLKLARAGRVRRIPGATLLQTIGSLRMRLAHTTRSARMANARPNCQPGMAC